MQMSPHFLTLLLIAPAIRASIDVQITAAADEANCAVKVAGQQTDVISNNDRAIFHIKDGALKRAVALLNGRQPDDVFVKSPTPWGDLYKTYHWKQVNRTLRPVRATILSVHKHPVSLATQHFENNSSKPASLNTTFNRQLINTISTTWNAVEMAVKHEINYVINFQVPSAGGTTFAFAYRWGQNITKRQTLEIDAGIEVDIDPHQNIVAELSATRISIKVQVFYEASLNGAVAANYADKYKGHHFWGMPIRKVMNSAGLESTKTFTQFLDIRFHVDPTTVMKDPLRSHVLYKYSMPTHNERNFNETVKR